ncbi:MAG: hypothetical protein ACR2NM_14540, partial [Bythopirellula sp.]
VVASASGRKSLSIQFEHFSLGVWGGIVALLASMWLVKIVAILTILADTHGKRVAQHTTCMRERSRNGNVYVRASSQWARAECLTPSSIATTAERRQLSDDS